MGSDTAAASFSVNGSHKASNYDEISMHHTLQFADRLKGLKNLREQLYSAAEHFESSYDKDLDHKQFVVESSKDYVTKALVSTVDHLGSVADKLNKFLGEKANEFSSTGIRFSCIEQRLNTYQGFIDLRGMSQQSLMIEAPKYHQRYIVPETVHSNQSKLMYGNCISCPQYDMQQLKQDNLVTKGFQAGRTKPQQPLLRKGPSRMPSNESSPRIPLNFFSRILSNKELGERSVSPLRFPLKRSGSVANTSASPSPSYNKPRYLSEPRRAVSLCTRPEMTNRVTDIESFKKRSKHRFKTLLSIHRSKKDILRDR